ncbi:mpv17-like protein [Triplophysa dalaica]|uniref:mpv17-like protein n=1 Tax=Triplophysa dalaica TaxID=1582913 RepID=UPI0024DF3CB9|nr:mpv17-like protein [Triplophysa dalaica]
MNRAWIMFKSHPYISNVVGYTALFASADLIQQSLMGETLETGTLQKQNEVGQNTSIKRLPVPEDEDTRHMNLYNPKVSQRHGIDWTQTARVALVGFCFHANLNYHWLRALEKMFPGGGAKKILIKVGLDQLIAAPTTISAFYIGLSTLEGAEDPLEDWRDKFWTSYKTGVVYWSTMQAVNFSLIPPVARTIYVGGAALIWTVFLCHFRQQKSNSLT